ERSAIGPDDFLRLDAERAHRGAVGANEAGIKSLIHVGDRRLVEQIAETLFTRGQGLASLLELIADALLLPLHLREFARRQFVAQTAHLFWLSCQKASERARRFGRHSATNTHRTWNPCARC